MADTPPLPEIPAALLTPLVTGAGDVLRSMKPGDTPPSLRPLLGFDRRGFASSQARAQLQRTLEQDADFRARVLEAFAARPEVVAMLASWGEGGPVGAARQAAGRDDLPLLASALVAARPDGWELGLGAVVAIYDQGVEQRSVEEELRAFDERLEREAEARRRAEEEAAELRERVDGLAEELRVERASRREREESVRAEAGDAERRLIEAEGELADARQQIERLEERVAHEVERAGGLQDELREARDELAAARRLLDDAKVAPPDPLDALGVSTEDLALVARAGEVARRVVDRITQGRAPAGPRDTPRPPASAPPPERPPRPAGARRARVPVPAGMVATNRDGLDAALRTGDPTVLVDGYNVTMLAWPDLAADAQRQRLCAELERLHLRTRVPITVVFDGADVEGVSPLRRPGVRVLFSAADEEADDVVVREVRRVGLDRSVVVVSSDRRVQAESEAEGALAVSSETFVELLRR